MISSCDVGSIIYPRQEGLFLPNLDSRRLSTLNLFVTNWRLLMGKGEGRSTWGREIRFCRSYVICKYWVQLKTLGTQLEYIIGWLRKLTPRLNIHIPSSGGVQGVGGGVGETSPEVLVTSSTSGQRTLTNAYSSTSGETAVNKCKTSKNRQIQMTN